MSLRRVGPLVLALAVACIWAIGGVSATKSPGAKTPSGYLRADARLGIVYTGLARSSGGTCRTLFQVRTGKHGIGCTHGPDPAPDGRNVLVSRSIADLRALVPGSPRTLSGAVEPPAGP
jgi:hypothetical protein